MKQILPHGNEKGGITILVIFFVLISACILFSWSTYLSALEKETELLEIQAKQQIKGDSFETN